MNLKLNRRQKGVLGASGILIIISITILSIGFPMLFDLTQFGGTPKCFEELNCRNYPILDYVLPIVNEEYVIISGTLSFTTSEIFSEVNPILYNFVISADPKYVKEVYVLLDNESKDFGHFNGMMKNDIALSLNPTSKDIVPNSNYRAIKLGYANGFTSQDQLVFFNTGKISATILIVDVNEVVHINKKFDVIFDLVPFESKVTADENREDKNANKQMLALTWIGLGLAFMLLAGDFIVRVVLDE